MRPPMETPGAVLWVVTACELAGGRNLLSPFLCAVVESTFYILLVTVS